MNLFKELKKSFFVMKKREKVLFLGITFFSFFIFCLAIIYIVQLNKTVFNLKVGEYDLGGLNYQKTEEKLKKILIEENQEKILFKCEEEEQAFDYDELGIKIDYKKNAKKIYSIGRNGSFLDQLKKRFLSFFKSQKFNLDLEIDQKIFNETLKNRFNKYEIKKEKPSLVFNNNKLEIKKGHEGEVLALDKSYTDLFNKIKFLSDAIVQIKIEKDELFFKEAQLEKDKELAEKFISNELILDLGVEKWFLTPEEKAQWLDLDDTKYGSYLTLNQDKIKEYLISKSKDFNKNPIDAQIIVENEVVNTNGKGIEGRELEINDGTEKIYKNAFNSSLIKLSFKNKDPFIKNDESLKEIGIINLLGKGETPYIGSWGRRENIRVGSEYIKGTLVKSGEEFSFVDELGPITYSRGFKNAPVILPGGTKDSIGGGLCQVATTTFRAAVYAGMEITERWEHAYIVSTYGPGFDAAVFAPYKNLKFKNNSSGYIYINSYIKSGKLYFEIYGTKKGREVKVDGPRVTAYHKDGSTSAYLNQKVFEDGNLIYENSFDSYYRPEWEFH